MKTNFKKTTFLLLLLSALPLRSLANSNNDTILNYAYENGEIKILSGNGELYQFAHDKDGYKYIYYLFTNSEYLHLEQTDVEDDNSHYCLYTQDPEVAVWYNSETKKLSAPEVKWSLRYEGEDVNFNEYVKKNPYKCLWWKDADKPILLLFNVDNNREKKADNTTVLLYVMPPFSEKAKSDKLLQGNEVIKLNYGNKLGKSLNDFKNDTVFNKKIVTLNGVEYVFTRSDRAVVDSITANGVVIPVEDHPGGPRQIVAKLDNIPIERGNNVNIKIHYRYFDRDGKLKQMTDTRYLPINWERAKWWGVLLVIFAILVLIIVIAIILSKALNMKKNNNNTSSNRVQHPNGLNSDNTGEGQMQSENDPAEESQVEGGASDDKSQEEGGAPDDKKETRKGKGVLKSFFGKLFHIKDPQEVKVEVNKTTPEEHLPDESQETESMPEEQPKLNRFFTDIPTPEPSPTEPTDHDTTLEEQLKKSIKEIGEKEEVLKSLRNELNETKQELQETTQKLQETEESLKQANAETEKAKAASAKATEEAQAAAKIEFEQKETDLKEKLEVALKAQKAAEDALKDAQEEAQKEFDKKAKELEENCQAQVKAAQKALQDAEDAFRKAEAKAQKEFEEQKKAIEDDRDTKVTAAQNAEQQARDEKETAIKTMQKQCDEALKLWTDDRDAMLGRLQRLALKLKNDVEQMNESAFNGNCGSIQSGVKLHVDKLCHSIESGVWKDKTTGECLEELRAEYCKLLDQGTDIWINLLGRLYSYMSAAELKQKLLSEGLSFELVSDAFDTMQALLASMGIIVLNCSPGYDSGTAPVITRLFDYESSIDRVTNWIGGIDAVDKAIPDLGQTVYDFGQLAYFTITDLKIHKGSIIYHN